MAITKVTSGLISADASSIDLNIDAGTLYLDVSENRVGINTSSAKEKLDVSGAAVFTGTHATGTNAYGAAQGVMIHATSSTGFVTAVSNGANDVDLQLRGLNGGNANANQLVLDSSGRVGIGTDSPADILDIDSGAAHGNIYFRTSTAAGYDTKIHLIGGASNSENWLYFGYNGDADNSYIKRDGSSNMIFGVNNAERMRIDSSGSLLVGTTTALSSSNSGGACFLGLTQGRKQLQLGHTSSSSLAVAQFFGNSSTVTAGSITCNASATAYNTSSDYRLKENVDYDFTALDRVAQLKPARFNFIEDADITVDGFLAHEVQDIVPEAVTGEKDAIDSEGNPEYQGIDQSKLVPLLTKAIQEQQTIIDNLKTRIETLESA